MAMRGAGEMTRKLRTIATQYPDLVGRALFQEAEIEATEMKKITPVDTRPNQWYPYQIAPHPGQLRNSIHVEHPEQHGKTIEVIIATGPEADYAIFVHEDPDAFHPVGQWKFMESVLQESRSHMADRLARRLHFDRMRI